ncbi:hypothetical protein INT47_003467 [Mucor saturninus]|uniref:Uncharacterized protein n=1 Tax=Mucor saturninus TaxID=64648 RepID=A0A8H7RI09_9FUNG|nr:hypothetical protein INT47_003467 [Mucor saturninus]
MKADLNEYITSVKLAIKDFINPLHHYDLNCNIPGNNANVEKVKVHFLTHIPEDIRQYGTVLHYETEKGEHFNKHINENITYTNKLNPSRDVGLKFAKQSMMRHVLEGETWSVVMNQGYEKIQPMTVLYKLKDFSEPGHQELCKAIAFMNDEKYDEAFECFEKSSSYNNEYGLLFAGIFNFIAYGSVKRDPQKSLAYWSKASSLWNNCVAQYLLGCLYTSGDLHVDENFEEGFRWIKLAAKNGWTCAMLAVALVYIDHATIMSALLLEKIAKKDDNDNEPVEDGMLYLFGNKDFEVEMVDVVEGFERTAEVLDMGAHGPVEFARLFSSLDSDPRMAMSFWE